MAVPECAHRLMRCRPSLVRGRAAQVNPGGFTTPARRPSVPHRTAGCGKSSLRSLMAGSSPSLPDGSNPSAAIGVVCGRGRNPTLRLWPTIFSGKIDVFPGDRRSRLISSMTSVARA
uniref:Transposase n=1 Tax=Acinetobacter baumannii TaxID=470 RepID=Q2FD33_ACIBA|nr:Transposase [Acinetobacter baumannii]